MNYKLTATAIKNLKPDATGKPRKHADGGGLYLLVAATGVRLWRYKYRLGGKEQVFALGAYPEVTLAKARELHGNARELVAKGVHPRIQREADKHEAQVLAEDTFKAIAAAWITSETKWSNTYRAQVERFMKSDVYPAFGSLPIRQVSPSHILSLIKSVEARGAETVAIQIRNWCSQVFRYAAAQLKVDYDPTGILKGAVKRPKIKHNRALKPEEIVELLTQIGKFGGFRVTVIAIELLMLTFVRTVELRMASWSEFDLEKALWIIPAERMKMKQEHVVPLSKQVLALLYELKGITGAGPWLFPNNRRPHDCMTATTINRALERMGLCGKGTIGFSAHGFRGTASTILHGEGHPSDVIERQLAHAERNKIKAIYNQAQYIPERIALMQHWAEYIDLLRAQVK